MVMWNVGGNRFLILPEVTWRGALWNCLPGSILWGLRSGSLCPLCLRGVSGAFGWAVMHCNQEPDLALKFTGEVVRTLGSAGIGIGHQACTRGLHGSDRAE